MREEYAVGGPDVVLSRPLVDAIGERLAKREQSLVLLNRRGFATSVFCRQCAGDDRLSELQRLAGRARRRQRAPRAVSLLQLHGARADDVPAVRGALPRADRLRHRARRGRGQAPLPGRARRAARSRQRAAKGDADVAAHAVPRRRDRRPRRHADDCQGPRFPERHARRRRLGRRGSGDGRFPRVRTDVPAAHAGRWTRRPRRSARRGDRADASIPTTTASSSRAVRTTRPSTSGSCSSAGRCGIRRSSR